MDFTTGLGAAGAISDLARQRFIRHETRPLFLSNWERTAFIHYSVDRSLLQPQVPFPLDLRNGTAYVSLVAFTLRHLRFFATGSIASAILRPIANHAFLNLRTYVRVGDETGIYFLAEWLPNLISVLCGPRSFGLPYEYGLASYDHRHETGSIRGRVSGAAGSLEYSAQMDASSRFSTSETGSLDEFLLERYTAFTAMRSRRGLFRVWHVPWEQLPIEVKVEDDSLLRARGSWFESARLIGANYSPGVTKVWISKRLSIPESEAIHPTGQLCAAQK